MRRLLEHAARTLFRMQESYPVIGLATLFDRGAAQADRRFARVEVLDIRMSQAQRELVRPAARTLGQGDRCLAGLHLLLQIEARAEAPGAAEKVALLVGERGARADVGAEARAKLQAFLRRFVQRDAQRHAIGSDARRVCVDQHAVEILGRREPALQALDQLAIVGSAGRKGPQVAHQRRVVFFEPGDLELAERNRGTAFQRYAERGAPGRRVDARFTVRDAREQIAPPRDRCQRRALRVFPCGLREDLAGGELPF